MRICDPTAGSGGMLIECAHYIERKGGNPRNLTLHGQEKNLGTWAICKMNMLLHGLPDARIEKGDTIRDPKLVDEGELLLYDRVIANPPFSLDEWGRDVAENDGYGRFRFGVPPKTKGDLAFVQHMVAVLNGTGRLGVVLPATRRSGGCCSSVSPSATAESGSSTHAPPRSGNDMNTNKAQNHSDAPDGLRTEYDLDYGQSHRNRFASPMSGTTLAVVLEPDVARVFDSSESVNRLLRSVISALPNPPSRSVSGKS